MGGKYCGNSQVQDGGQSRRENTISPTSFQKYLHKELQWSSPQIILGPSNHIGLHITADDQMFY